MTNDLPKGPRASAEGSCETTADEARQFASEIIRKWPEKRVFVAEAVLDEHPELRRYSTIVLDLAHEEYRRRAAKGERIAPEEFAARFPAIQESLQILLGVEDYFDRHPDALAGLAETEWPEAGDTFLGFHLGEELGRGAFSRVFLASEIGVGNRTVVTKVCWRGGYEAHTLGKLKHPNIGPIFSANTDARSRLTAICMPYLSRATLFDVLLAAKMGHAFPSHANMILQAAGRVNHDGDLPTCSTEPHRLFRRGTYVDGIVRIGFQLAGALASAHKQGICHCDIKPSNVLVTDDGTALLVDFNLSQSEDGGIDRIGGTIPYMAPEQLEHISDAARDASQAYDERSDLFSLGATLYELLCGQLPFGKVPDDLEGAELARHLLQRQKDGAVPLRENNRRVDPKVARIVDLCLAYDVADRPQSADELAATLRVLLSPLQRFRRWTQTRPGKACAILGPSVLAVAAIGYIGATEGPELLASRELRLAWQADQRGQQTLALQHFRNAYEWDADVVDGRTLAYVAYLMCQEQDFRKAVEFNRLATESGSATAAVCNNLGYCHRMLGDFDLAIEWLKRALTLDNRLSAAYHNLAKAEWQQAARDGRTPDGKWLQDALRCCPKSPELSLDSACYLALREANRPENSVSEKSRRVQFVVGHCERAVCAGIHPDRLDVIVELLPAVQGDARFRILRKSSVKAVRNVKPVFVLNPLENT